MSDEKQPGGTNVNTGGGAHFAGNASAGRDLIGGNQFNYGAGAGAGSVDPVALRAALEQLYEALNTVPLAPKIAAQGAAGQAVQGVKDGNVEPATVVENVKKVADTLTQANTVIEQGSTLWTTVQKLAPIIAPLAGVSAQFVLKWFGIG